VQKGKVWCRSLVPDLRGPGGFGELNVYNVVGVIVSARSLSPEGRDGVTSIWSGCEAHYGFYTVVKERAC